MSPYDVLIIMAPSKQDEAWELPPFQLPGYFSKIRAELEDKI